MNGCGLHSGFAVPRVPVSSAHDILFHVCSPAAATWHAGPLPPPGTIFVPINSLVDPAGCRVAGCANNHPRNRARPIFSFPTNLQKMRAALLPLLLLGAPLCHFTHPLAGRSDA